jgi:manganese transport protein
MAGIASGAGSTAAEGAVPAAFPAPAFPVPTWLERWLARSWAARIARQGSLTDRTVAAAQDVLAGRRRGIAARLAFVGPAVIAAIAYMDPGNFATNIQAGAKYGYSLLWVVVMANLIAMLFQALSAKLGIVTGRNLAELCREEFPKPVVWAMWGVSEGAAMATDLAEFLGGAIGLALLLRMPLLAGMAVTAVVTYAILMFEGRGFRPVELIIGGLVGVIGLCYLAEMLIAPVNWGAAAYHTLVPEIADREALLLAVGIVGATVMPHAIFLHSGLTQARTPVGADGADADGADAARRRVLGFSNQEVVIALAVAGMVNMAMVMMASSAFHAGHGDVAEIETAYHTLTPLLGGAAAGVFLLSLIASGISSSAVGTMAGQMIMQGFVGFRIPVALRRLVTMLPAFVVVGLGANTTTALVISQVVLSIALPLPMITLLVFTRRRDLMGPFANGWATQAAAIAGTAIVLALNLFLILQTVGVALPRL